MNTTKILVAVVVLLCMSAITVPMVSAGTADEIGLPDYKKHPGLAIRDTIISVDPISSLLKTTWDVSHGNVPTAGPVHSAYWRFTFDTLDRTTEMLKSAPSASDLWREYEMSKTLKPIKPISIEPIKVPTYQPPTIKPIKVPTYKPITTYPSYRPSSFDSRSRY